MRTVITGYTAGKKILGIKGLRAVTGLGLKDAKDVLDDVDAGRQPLVTVFDVTSGKHLDEHGVTWRPAELPLGEFVASLSSFPRDITVGTLHDVLTVTLAHAGESSTNDKTERTL